MAENVEHESEKLQLLYSYNQLTENRLKSFREELVKDGSARLLTEFDKALEFTKSPEKAKQALEDEQISLVGFVAILAASIIPWLIGAGFILYWLGSVI